MLTISKPLSAGQAQRYHVEEFSNTRSNYYSAGDRIVGQWHGQLASAWGPHGEVRDDHFERLADGRHPITGEQLVRQAAPTNQSESFRTASTQFPLCFQSFAAQGDFRFALLKLGQSRACEIYSFPQIDSQMRFSPSHARYGII